MATRKKETERNPKSTHAELQKRINVVYTLLLRCEPQDKILQYAASEWGVAERTARHYIGMATKRMEDDLQRDRHQLLAREVAMLDDLYNKSYLKEKYWHCLEISRHRSELLGLKFGTADHLKAVQAAGYTISNGTESEAPSKVADRAATEFFPEDGNDRPAAQNPG